MAVTIDSDEVIRLERVLDEALLQTLDLHNWRVFTPDGHDDDMDVYEHLRRGKCMLCGEPLGEDTIIVVDAQGILGIWCDGNCLTDMQAISFLEGVLNDLVARYNAREDDA